MKDEKAATVAAALCTSGDLRALREKAKRTQFTAAVESGVSLPTWQRWERGRPPTHPDMVRKLLAYTVRLHRAVAGAARWSTPVDNVA